MPRKRGNGERRGPVTLVDLLEGLVHITVHGFRPIACVNTFVLREMQHIRAATVFMSTSLC